MISGRCGFVIRKYEESMRNPQVLKNVAAPLSLGHSLDKNKNHPFGGFCFLISCLFRAFAT